MHFLGERSAGGKGGKDTYVCFLEAARSLAKWSEREVRWGRGIESSGGKKNVADDVVSSTLFHVVNDLITPSPSRAFVCYFIAARPSTNWSESEIGWFEDLGRVVWRINLHG